MRLCDTPRGSEEETAERYARSEPMRQQTARSYKALDTAQWTRRDTPRLEMNHWHTPVVSNHFAKSTIYLICLLEPVILCSFFFLPGVGWGETMTGKVRPCWTRLWATIQTTTPRAQSLACCYRESMQNTNTDIQRECKVRDEMVVCVSVGEHRAAGSLVSPAIIIYLIRFCTTGCQKLLILGP